MLWFLPVADNDPRLKNRTISFGLPDFGLDDGDSDADDDLFFSTQVNKLTAPVKNDDHRWFNQSILIMTSIINNNCVIKY